MSRFRLRLFARSLPTFETLFLGILAESFLVMFSLNLPSMFSDYADRLAAFIPVGHTYTLKAPFELETTDRQRQRRDELATLAGLSGETGDVSGQTGAATSASGSADGGTSLSPGSGDSTSGVSALVVAAEARGLGDIAEGLAADLHPVAAEGETRRRLSTRPRSSASRRWRSSASWVPAWRT